MASITVIFGGQEQRTFDLDRPRLVVGREPSCEIHIDNLGISRQHCAFEVRGEAYLVQDLGSSNGTYVNGRKVTELFLNNEDEVVIGKYTLKFKNALQTAAAPATKDEAGVPDTLNTYVMDGQKIQEQLAKMRQTAMSGSAPGAAGGASASGSRGAPGASAGGPPAGATAKDYARAYDVAGASPAGGGSKKIVIALVAVVVVLVAVVVAMMLMK